MNRHLVILFVIFGLTAGSGLRADEFQYTVKLHHLLKDSHGTLTINDDGVEYSGNRAKDNRKWRFDDIQTLEVKSPTQISIVTYEDQKRFAGKDRVFDFTFLDKKATPELSRFLLSRVKRPMKLAVIPEDSEKPAFEIPVKHLHTVSGDRGVLRIYPDRIVYQSSKVGESRYWRLADIERFSQPDRFRFEIVSYVAKAGGPTEAYNFQLMEDLPEGVYDYLWVRLHPSSYYPAIQR